MRDDTTAGSVTADADAAIIDTTAPAANHLSDVRRRRIALGGGLALVIGALVLFTIGRCWGSGPSGYLVARQLDAPVLWPVVAVLGALVLWAVRRARRGRTALDVLAWVLVPVIALTVTRFAWLSIGTEQFQRSPSPDGSRSLVIESVPSILDPEWEIRLESGQGPASRYRVIDCVNGDWSNVERAQWLSPTTAKIIHHSGADPADEIATTVTFAGTPDGRVDMSGHSLDSCTPGSGGSPQ